MIHKQTKKTNNNARKIFVLLFFVVLIAILIIGICMLFSHFGIWEKINSIEKIKTIVENGGVFSFLIFMLLQILQTTILQVPAIIVTIAGTIIFGRFTAFILSFLSVMIGSVLMFWLGRKAGRKCLNFFAGKDKSQDLINRISQCKYLFFLMMLFPLFPDDILCVVAGVTNMSFGFFFWTNVITRFLGIGCTVFFGSGKVIPFSGWGLLVWGCILIIIASLFYLSIKYQDKIDVTLNQLFKNKHIK